jgi:hypothetical protein
MSTTTTNYGLVKPALSDAADITAMNKNWDKIDTELKKKYDADNKPSADDLAVPTLKEGTSIPANSDLNNYATIGNYSCESNTTAATLTNCPTKRAFTMKVYYTNGSPAYIGQEITEFNSGVTYYRYKDVPNKTWSDWETRYSTANKPSGYYEGNGDATSRTINIGGTGSVLLINGGSSSTFVTSRGAICLQTGNTAGATIVGFFPYEVKFQNGVLTLKTSNAAVNNVNFRHTYEVL